jgi:bis(5'-nucleosyl)-tetraphosphatase (symmetrical)
MRHFSRKNNSETVVKEYRYTYAIGDVQGCFSELQKLLQHIQFDKDHDRLWFVGDLVNRGEDSLSVLRFVKSLGAGAITVLGNHDLHFLAVASGVSSLNKYDTLSEVLLAPDCDELCDWLRRQPLLYHDEELGFTLVHAGLPPEWDLNQARCCANELELVLQSDAYQIFLQHMHGNEPRCWNSDLSGMQRLRYITNALTRIRFCNSAGELNFTESGDLVKSPLGYMPWFQIPERKNRTMKIVFGHWAALYNQWQEVISTKDIFPLDSGCIWGHCLSALRLEDGLRFKVDCG